MRQIFQTAGVDQESRFIWQGVDGRVLANDGIEPSRPGTPSPTHEKWPWRGHGNMPPDFWHFGTFVTGGYLCITPRATTSKPERRTLSRRRLSEIRREKASPWRVSGSLDLVTRRSLAVTVSRPGAYPSSMLIP